MPTPTPEEVRAAAAADPLAGFGGGVHLPLPQAQQGGFDFLGLIAALLVGAIALLVTKKLSGPEGAAE